jgi:hypothetical protein
MKTKDLYVNQYVYSQNVCHVPQVKRIDVGRVRIAIKVDVGDSKPAEGVCKENHGYVVKLHRHNCASSRLFSAITVRE